MEDRSNLACDEIHNQSLPTKPQPSYPVQQVATSNGDMNQQQSPEMMQQPALFYHTSQDGVTHLSSAATGWSNSPQQAKCLGCNETVETIISYKPGVVTYKMSMLACALLGWICCLCFVPFCLNATKDVIHTCPKCNNQLGIHRLGFNG